MSPLPPLLLLCSLALLARAASPGVHSLTVEEAVEAGIPLAFSPVTALAALHARHAASLPPPGAPQPRASLQPHLPALRQVAQLCASAATVGARDSAPLWALFLGLAEAQHAAQAVRQAREQQQQQPLPPVPRAWLHSEPWGAASSHADAPPALLLPLGRALGVDVSLGAPGAGPWQLAAASGGGGGGAAAVDFVLLDGARSHGEVLRDLLSLAPRAGKYIGLPHSEYAPREGGGEPPLHTTGVKAAVFDFLFVHNNTAAWEVSAHFGNHAGFTLLGRRR